MPLSSGTRLGVYEILAKLGEGGMGEVYRARDARLNRDVAIKLLPDAFAADGERLARFEREAQTLASLNHHNIAHIYGVVDAGGSGTALVMELVEGVDLAERTARGPLPIDEAIAIARQIADALEAAHEQGIVHRDLKPANIKVRPDGTVKVLDFGLAKALDPAGGTSGPAIANSPTFTAHATHVGVIMGTAAYMAPEQARGKAVDRRADIWAFGAVLYEMLTGCRAFEGADISEVLASVLKSDPQWSAIPSGTPSSVHRLLRRCLEKDPRRRLSAIGDARLDLEDTDAPALAAVRGRTATRLWTYVIAAAAGAVVTAAAGAAWFASVRTAAPATQRFSLLPPPGQVLYPDSSAAVISPDGTTIAFVVGGMSRSDTRLWVRSLDSMVARKLDDTDGATLPFWSPDSRRLAFFTSSKLKAVSVSGGRAQVLADLSGGGRGGAWGPNNVIVYAPDATGPLFRVNASGGTPAQATALDAERQQYAHRFPVFLPGGDRFLYAVLPGKSGRFDIFAGSLTGAAPVFVGALESAPVYADPGYLLYGRQGILAAQPFDSRTLKLTGEAITLPDEPSVILDPQTSYTAGRVTSVSSTGAIAYYSAPSANTVAEWYDMAGHRVGTVPLPPGHYEYVRISPDGTQAAIVRSISPAESTLWAVDLARGGMTPLSSGPGRNDVAIWSPDGSKVVFTADRDGAADFFVKTVGDATPEQPLFRSPAVFKGPNAWTADGGWIIMTEIDPSTSQNVALLPAGGARDATPLVQGPTRDIGGPVSPDGRWLAYFSDQTGRFQLYVQSFPGPGRRVQVSQNGAVAASWSRDGRELLFLGDNTRSVWRVSVTPGATFSAGAPTLVVDLPPNILALDVSPDHQRILALAPEQTGTGTMTVVLNWRASLAQRQ